MSKKIVQLNEEVIKGQLKELVRGSVEETLNELLEQEAEKLTQAARYERNEARQGYRSGHYDRNLTTTSGDVTLHMPRLKGVSFETAIIERYRRRESSVEEALIEMYLAGVSVRRVEDITEALWGSKVSPATISELNKKAYVHIEDWRNRPLQGGKYPYVYVDGIYLRRNWGGEYENVAILVAIAVNEDGYREVLGAAEGKLRRGTPARKSDKGKVPGYSPKLGEAVYRANRASCHRHPKAGVCSNFTSWVVRQIREHKWSLDACCGYAKRHSLFEPSEMVCSRTLYNMVWKGCLSIQPTELPEALKRKTKKHRVRENKKRYGTSISSRPEIASLRLEEGHWEGDTVVGKRAGKESVVLSLLEKKTETYLAFRIPGKTSEAVMNLMNTLHDEYGEHFSQVFKTITVDNGSEFADFAQVENWGSKVFFAHPYTSWERPQNERHNGLFRAFVPKGASIEGFTDEDILAAADELNGRPRKKLGYCTPEELFEAFLDAVYAA